MELDINMGKVFCFDAADDKKAVIPIDCSIILPDYFPDVMKILRYTAKAVKSPVISEGNNETVGGNVSVEVSYVSEEGELCSCFQLMPFSHSFECEGKVRAAEADIKVGEIGCRAVNKRRIDLHGSMELILRTLCGEEKSIVSSVSGGGAVCKKESAETISVIGEFYKNFTVEEKGELGYGKPPFGKILRSSCFAQVNECHVIQDKVVTKGEVKVTVLWVPEELAENGEKGPFLSSFTFPVSRMVDANGILLTDICDARYEADFAEITPTEDGENVFIKVKVGIFARVYRKEKTEYVNDMFSTEYDINEEKEKIFVIKEAIPLSFSETVYEKIDLPEEAEEIIDIWAEPGTAEIKTGEKPAFNIKFCMFVKDGDGNPLYFEKTGVREIPFSKEKEKTAFYNISVGVKNNEYSITRDRKAEISSNVIIDGTAYMSMSTKTLVSCSLSTDKKNAGERAGITLCYAEKGERLWDIAKRYRADIKEIMNENKIEDEIIEKRTMIVILG